MTAYSVTNALVDTDPDTMSKEIEAAEKQRELCLANYDRLLRNAMATEEWPEALTHQYLSFMIPRIVQENPTVAVGSRAESSDLVIDQTLEQLEVAVQTGAIAPENAMQMAEQLEKPGHDALASQHGLKRWIEQEDFRDILDRHCDAYLKAASIGHTWIDRMPNQREKRWPKTGIIDARRFLMDPAALHYCETAWRAHWYPVPKPKLQKMAEANEDGQGKWDKAAIESLTPSADDAHGVDRKQVRVFEVWLANDELNESGDPDINGQFLTLAGTMDGGTEKRIQIREPRPAYVPPWGPYTMYGCYNRTGKAWPMSPLLATFMQQDEIQKHAHAMNINARQYKRVVIVSDSNPLLVQQLKNAPDHLVIPVKDDQFTKDKVAMIELGGISDQQLAMYAQLLRAFQRTLGMDDQQSGKVDSQATATAVAVADESVSTRVSYIEGKFIAAVRRNLRSVLWYMVMDERVNFRLGRDVAEAMQMIEPWFKGGLRSGEIFDFDDLELVIDPYSMGRVSEQALQRRVTEFVASLIQMAPAMMQFPFIDWRQVIRSMTQVLNLPGLDGAIDFNMLQQMGQMQQAMGMASDMMAMSGDQAVKQSKSGGSGGGGPKNNAQQLIQNRVGGNIGNLNYKGAA